MSPTHPSNDSNIDPNLGPDNDAGGNKATPLFVTETAAPITSADYLSWAGILLAMLLVFELKLLSALIAGLLVHELVHGLAGRLQRGIFSSGAAKQAAAILIAATVVLLLATTIFGTAAALRHGSIGLPELFQKLAEIIDNSREHLPPALLNYLPNDAEDLRRSIVEWLRQHSSVLQGAGERAVRISAHILVGMVLGALLALRGEPNERSRRPLATAISGYAARLSTAFRRVVLAQAWIAGLNTIFTWFYLSIALPLAGIHLPLTKTMIAITFFAGLIPILGNLVSNSIIVIVSLNESLPVAAISLAFLIAVHKLEYFLNARIVGSRIHAAAWEILLAMLLMESAFGLAGVIAAPIFYAFIKQELASRQLI